MTTPIEERPPKPFGSAVQQQTMTSFSPQHSPQAVVTCLFLVAIIFIPIGAAVIVASDAVNEVEVRYDDVKKCTRTNNDGILSTTIGANTFTQGCVTRRTFTLTKPLSKPVYLYYRVVGFHQNYRPYGISRSDWQLTGEIYAKTDSYLSDCAPLLGPDGRNQGNTPLTVTGAGATRTLQYSNMVYHPCGAIAWSMFNDTIALYKVPSAPAVTPYPSPLPTGSSRICDGSLFGADGRPIGATTQACEKSGIALSADRNTRFKAAPVLHFLWTGSGANSTDPYHANGFYAGEAGHRLPVATDEDYMVWARLAGLADFRKPYRKITTDLAAGDYALEINEFWDVTQFSGEKYVILATTSWIGGKNYVLGTAYLVMGSLSFVLAAAFLAHYLVSEREQQS